ncbi:hypothetical protein F480_00100 [Bibersteinia trehalosi Y31]|uniref:HEPN AbiU2-like domain-containing protein n=1 Tax=Bibersteinia trehalosi Y31 TaxID=1261658 RepID=A0A179D0U8_BIBTR|nr:hypothetical protein [Bibersteinia trehalosi]OAQ15779.1 hypothetical protein F480_00100 [Bibersteinia trehalosi Y31]
MTKKHILPLIDKIHKRLDMANHYIKEYSLIREQASKDSGKIFNRYYFSLAYVKKAYLEYAILILTTLYENNGEVNFRNLRINIENSVDKKLMRAEQYAFDFERILNGLKTIRDKTIAHLEELDENKSYQFAAISLLDIEKFIQFSQCYLRYLIQNLDIDLNQYARLNNFSNFGFEIIYALIEKEVNRDPDKELQDFLNEQQKLIDIIQTQQK